MRGQWSDQFGHGNGGVHMTITCLHVAGNEAWVTGVSDKGEFAGWVWMARMRDNGKSGDEISNSLFLPAGVEIDCHTMPQFEMFVREHGQVKID